MTCIGVPIYKKFDALSLGERSSLNQLFKVLASHPIYFFSHEHLDLRPYFNQANKIGAQMISSKLFDKKYFQDIDGYNQLLKSLTFYNAFREHKFMLIYQLDAWVFRDELNYWCQKGYDYIGAPWFEGWNKPTSNEVIGIGNGGFSLRNIRSAIRILGRIQKHKAFRSFWYRTKLQSVVKYETIIRWWCRRLHIKNLANFKNIINGKKFQLQEDGYWTLLIAKTFDDYKVAPYETAAKFSMEVNAPFLFAQNDNKLPFGCHAWEKFEPEFWKEYIHA